MREAKMKDILRHLSSSIAPIVMWFVLPSVLVLFERQPFMGPVITSSIGLLMVRLAVGVGGLVLLIVMARMFIMIGNGTIMPWVRPRS